jgi:Fe2+ transport system protein FeoA
MSIKTNVKLCQIQEGQSVKLKLINGGQMVKQRLAAMGIIPGQIIEVLRNSYPGPFVIKAKGTKVVLGRGMADKIFVEKL